MPRSLGPQLSSYVALAARLDGPGYTPEDILAHYDSSSQSDSVATLPTADALLGRDLEQQTSLTLGADPQCDNYLYQLWIFYELAALLREGGQLLADGLTFQPMRLRFRWQDCSYELFHDQTVPLPVSSWQSISEVEHHVPGVRPDFYIQRCDPSMQRVTADEKLIWREPGLIWDAIFGSLFDRLAGSAYRRDYTHQYRNACHTQHVRFRPGAWPDA